MSRQRGSACVATSHGACRRPRATKQAGRICNRLLGTGRYLQGGAEIEHRRLEDVKPTCRVAFCVRSLLRDAIMLHAHHELECVNEVPSPLHTNTRIELLVYYQRPQRSTFLSCQWPYMSGWNRADTSNQSSAKPAL